VMRARTRIRFVSQQLQFLYSHFSVIPEPSVVDFDVLVRHKGPLRSWISVLVDGGIFYDWFRSHLALPLFEWAVNHCIFERPHQYLMLHSAVVEKQGRAVILPGPPGSGKSTLCAGLVCRGWRLLSDEVALVRPQDAMIVPIPRPIGLKNDSIRMIRGFSPQAALGPSWPGTIKGELAHMQPPAESVRRSHETARPAWLVFPSYRAGAKADLTSVSKAQGLLRAAKNSFNYSVLGRTGFEALAKLIDGCGCYEFIYSDLAEAVEQIERLPAS
jgi:HprK-related kinase A